jgi:hypothetical protein
MIGSGSGVTEVWVKALYTYAYAPRIWFFFRWEDPSHTIQPVQPASEHGKVAPIGGTHQYYWYQKGGKEIPVDGFKDGRVWASHEDWLALAWSTECGKSQLGAGGDGPRFPGAGDKALEGRR